MSARSIETECDVAAGSAGPASRVVVAVANAAVSVGQCESVPDVVGAILDQMAALGASASSIYTIDRSTPRQLRMIGSRNVPDEWRREVCTLPLDGGSMASVVATTGELHVIDDLRSMDPNWTLSHRVNASLGTRTLVGVPMKAFGTTAGVLLWALRAQHRFSADQRAAVLALAEVFGVALAKAFSRSEVTPPSGLDVGALAAVDQYLLEAIASRGHAEIRLREHERRLRAILDHSVHFVGLLATDGTLLEANRAALEFIGAAREDVVGLRFWQTPWWEDGAREAVKDGIERAARGESVRFESAHPGTNGRRIHVDFSISPVRDETGTVVLLVPEGNDVTERKEAERFREEWTSIVAHDLRQPVNALKVWTQVLGRTMSTVQPAAVESIGHVRAAVQQLDRMIADLLDASRLEAGRLLIRPAATEVDTLVRAVIARMGLPSDRPIELHLADALPRVHVDAGRIEQVLANLLGNAAKYGYAGTPLRVEVSALERAVQVSVSNRGAGIEREELPNLFRRFVRTRKASESRTAGIGLGLYIARGLVEAHGGRMSVTSVPGEWTTFAFTLPEAKD